jgi:hypothetical protein
MSTRFYPGQQDYIVQLNNFDDSFVAALNSIADKVSLNSAPTFTGNVTAPSFIGSLSGNATTATNVTWSGITGKPTTVAGYGITDALTPSNYNSYAPSLTGVGASGSWGISISGIAASATNVAWTGITSKPTTLSGFGITDAPTSIGTGASGSWGISITGNAATATSATSATSATTAATATNVAWTGITGKPSTLSGYGITDAPTTIGTGASGTWGINISGNAPWANITGKPATIAGYGITDATFLPLAGGTVTGALTVNGTLVSGTALKSDVHTNNAGAITVQTTNNNDIVFVRNNAEVARFSAGNSLVMPAAAGINFGPSYITGGTNQMFLAPGGANGLALTNLGNAAVNYFELQATPTTVTPVFRPIGSDANIGLAINAKGTGVVTFGSDVVLNTTAAIQIPVGSTAQRPTPATGKIRYNSDLAQFEGYGGSAWGALGGGATGGAGNSAFYENDSTITQNYTITTNKNAMSAGPITINSGVTVTVPSGSVWTIVGS